jgi:hypothetical protein
VSMTTRRRRAQVFCQRGNEYIHRRSPVEERRRQHEPVILIRRHVHDPFGLALTPGPPLSADLRS